MSGDLTWPILCLIAGLGLLVVEVFIPSGGLLGLLAVGLLVIGVWRAFAISTATGVRFLVVLVGLLPPTLALAVYLWPRTPFAKRAFLSAPRPEDIEPEPTGPRLDLLIGQFGRAVTPLRPSGLVNFDGRRIDGLSEEGLIPAGALVRAVGVRAGQLVVRAATDPSLDDLLT